jgi:WD40 repeat protein
MAVEQRARTASVAEDGGRSCIATFDGTLEIWDRKADRRLSEVALGDSSTVIVTPEGCAAMVDDELHLAGSDGAASRLASGVTAVGWDGGEILAAIGSEVRVFDVNGEAGARFEVDPGGTAVARVGPWLVVGYREGDVALYPLDATMPRPSYSFEEVPSSAVVRLLGGPMGTVIIGFSDGTLGIWKLDNGSLMERMRLHGAVVHIALEEDRLYAATELGDVGAWDLGIFEDDYCELLMKVWGDVPVVWENGLPVRRDPPDDHRCRRALD